MDSTALADDHEDGTSSSGTLSDKFSGPESLRNLEGAAHRWLLRYEVPGHRRPLATREVNAKSVATRCWTTIDRGVGDSHQTRVALSIRAETVNPEFHFQPSS